MKVENSFYYLMLVGRKIHALQLKNAWIWELPPLTLEKPDNFLSLYELEQQVVCSSTENRALCLNYIEKA